MRLADYKTLNNVSVVHHCLSPVRPSLGIPADIMCFLGHIRYLGPPHDAFNPQMGSAFPLIAAAAVASTMEVSGNGCYWFYVHYCVRAVPE